ncbi:aminodeoxychorismate synthase, subunit I [Desulfuromonas soudanensis]|uniref:Aminodeoxychorismate synthase, subunit I n=1 Tax=Desulfuromonas soudanensis TaxID=1603606 RepID=A0A0M3QFC5_9BACT|nr:anthranilate synthase component I family protein [Desulfuromonas soudanensis]ALC15843.1 aminodeoxychorismate synthase, subunit I [Desulfuromonas soudanensis]
MSSNCRTFSLERFDPLLLTQRLCPEGPGFLETLNSSAKTGRYSIVPLRRREAYRLDRGGLMRIEAGVETPLEGDPFLVLGALLESRRRSDSGVLFPGGFFGTLGYDLSAWIETLPQRAARDLPVPALWLDWVDLTAVYDHDEKTLTLASLDPQDDLFSLEEKVRRALAVPLPLPAPGRTAPLVPRLSEEDFTAMVRRAKEYIEAGDIYQANLSCRFDGPYSGSAADLYRRLRAVNPSPFASLLRLPGVEIVSSSPERLVSLHNGVAETRPIAGTRPRGYTPPEDSHLGEELLAHPKERAEHVMLVDLERNDLGKVCCSGTVEVDELMVLERYSHVTHIVSNVRGLLRDGVGPFELLRAVFPGGTVTGVPKKRCMEIIDELEPTGRGSYTGSAGYISVTGGMDFNILIRTFQKFGATLTYQVGAGIVADSIPEREWQECLAKGRALQQALEDFP